MTEEEYWMLFLKKYHAILRPRPIGKRFLIEDSELFSGWPDAGFPELIDGGFNPVRKPDPY